jgi:hypothetical protein
MAAFVCSAIVGFLCLQVPIGSDVNVKLVDQGIYVANTFQAKDWTLSWGRSTEWAPPQLDMAKLSKACDGAACVLYWRKCDDAARPSKCSYGLVLGEKSSVYFDLTATDADGLKHAMDAFRIVADLASGAAVPLSKLDRDGPGDQAPLIRTDKPAP